MELIVVSDPHYFKGEAELINQLFDAGLSIFHLRKQDADSLPYKNLIAEIHEAYHDKIAVHQFHNLVHEFAIKRIHYPEGLRKETLEKDLPDKQDLILSTSIHLINELSDLNGFDYIFFGPVFNSLSKPGYKACNDFTLPKDRHNTKIIALGGIDADKIERVKEMKFDGAAVLGAIWNDPLKALYNYKKIQDKC